MTQSFEQLSNTLWVARSRAFSFNSGILISDGQVCLIDPGMFRDEIEGIKQFAIEHEAGMNCIVLTHSHWDHILGPEHFPGVKVIAHRDYLSARLGMRNAERRKRTLDEIERWEGENGVARDKPFAVPMPNSSFDGSMMILLARLPLQLIHAPGHWPDQLVAYEPEGRVLWAGDMLSDIEIPYVSHSLAAYEKTLETLKGMDVAVLVPGHGNATADFTEITRRLTEDAAYLKELRQATGAWVGLGSLPEMNKPIITAGFTPSPRLEANLYSHRLNIETVWLELGGKPDPAHPGWEGS
jgi:glyoxylase-like metal-dependent hydrolase (beta-lactamase superfamily II)